MKSKLIVLIIITCVLKSCTTRPKNTYNSKNCIKHEVDELTNLQLDTTQFIVLVDTIIYNENAFDLDYTWLVKVRFNDNYFNDIKSLITSSKNYNLIESEFDPNWICVDTTSLKGVWFQKTKSLVFIRKPNKFNTEPINLSIDGVTKTLDLKLIHL